VILNAGNGDRLGTGLPKGCLEVGGKALALRIADALGEPQPLMVVGFEARRTMALFGDRFRYAVNPDWEATKTGGSLLAAREHWEGRPTLVVASDHLFGAALARRVRRMRLFPASVLLDRGARLDGEEQVVLADGKLAWPVPRDVPVLGECPEIFWLSDGRLDVGPGEDVFEGMNRREFWTVGTRAAPWIEIDTPEDLARAEAMCV
jgi:choline kinase